MSSGISPCVLHICPPSPVPPCPNASFPEGPCAARALAITRGCSGADRIVAGIAKPMAKPLCIDNSRATTPDGATWLGELVTHLRAITLRARRPMAIGSCVHQRLKGRIAFLAPDAVGILAAAM